MGSLDVQSYAAIGRLAAIGLDPYNATPGWLADPYGTGVDPMWRWTPTPYGPLQVALLRVLVLLAGDHVGTAVLLIRAVAVLGCVCAVLLALRAVPLTERVPLLLVTALNPILLVHVVSGAHLDVLVGALALLVVGLTRSGRPAAAMALAVVASGLKLPGAVLAGFVLLHLVRSERRGPRAQRLLGVVGAGLATVGVVLALCPNPFGWVAALGVPGRSRNAMAPSTWTSYVVAVLTGRLSGPDLDLAFTVGRTLTAIAGAAVCCALLWKATSGSRRWAYAGVGWALVVVALASPALYPWYLLWGLFCAAAGSDLRRRLVLIGLSSAACLAAALSAGSLAVATWVAVTVAVLAFTWQISRALLARAQTGPPAVPVAVPGDRDDGGRPLGIEQRPPLPPWQPG
jgi:hypothetical protein